MVAILLTCDHATRCSRQGLSYVPAVSVPTDQRSVCSLKERLKEYIIVPQTVATLMINIANRLPNNRRKQVERLGSGFYEDM